MKILLWIVGIIFLVGLLVVGGVLDLIFYSRPGQKILPDGSCAIIHGGSGEIGTRDALALT